MYIIIPSFQRGALCKDGDKVQAVDAAAKVLQGMGFGLNAAALASS